MSTEIATQQETPPAPTDMSALMLWARDANQAHRIAQMLAKTSFVPASLRGKAEDITAALLAGQELGLQPMATLRSIDIIQGTPALRAHAMRGLVQSHGHKVWIVEQGPTRVVMRGARRIVTLMGAAQYEPEQEVVWTLDRASQLGLIGKPEWKKQPATMLTARATGEICRLIASDVLYAMPYAAEELDEEQPPVKATARVTAADLLAKVTPALPAEPEAPSEPATEPTTEDWPDVPKPPDAEA